MEAIRELINEMEALKKTKLYENSFKAIDDCICLAYNKLSEQRNFPTKEDAILWVQFRTPIAIKPLTGSKQLIYPFTSKNAFNEVTKSIGNHFYNFLNPNK
jgi:hypothetical protein